MINIDKQVFNKYYEDIFNLVNHFKDSESKTLNVLEKLKLFINDESTIIAGHEIDKKLVSFVWCYKRKFGDVERLHISYFIVDKPYRGKGLSKDLMFFIQEKAVENNIGKIDLNVNPDNIRAINVYKNAGFIPEKIQLVMDLKENKNIQ